MIIKHQYNKLTIPIELITYSYQRKLVKPLAFYIALKFYSNGKLSEFTAIKLLTELFQIKQARTVKLHLQTLQTLNWIGYNPRSRNYFIRGFNTLINSHSFTKRHAASCYLKDLKNIESFFVGAVLSKHLNGKKYLNVIRGKKNLAATNNRDVALQPTFSLSNHLGLSNSIIAQIFGCSYTRACQLKQQAATDGYIEAKHKYKMICKDLPADFNLRNYLPEFKYGNRLKLITFKNGSLNLVQQEYDELTPLVHIKNRRKKRPYGKSGLRTVKFV